MAHRCTDARTGLSTFPPLLTIKLKKGTLWAHLQGLVAWTTGNTFLQIFVTFWDSHNWWNKNRVHEAAFGFKEAGLKLCVTMRVRGSCNQSRGTTHVQIESGQRNSHVLIQIPCRTVGFSLTKRSIQFTSKCHTPFLSEVSLHTRKSCKVCSITSKWCLLMELHWRASSLHSKVQ